MATLEDVQVSITGDAAGATSAIGSVSASLGVMRQAQAAAAAAARELARDTTTATASLGVMRQAQAAAAQAARELAASQTSAAAATGLMQRMQSEAADKFIREANSRQRLMRDIFDNETRGFERLAATQASAIAAMSANLKRFHSEEDRAERERFDFAQRMAPAMAIGAMRTTRSIPREEGILAASLTPQMIGGFDQNLRPLSGGIREIGESARNATPVMRHFLAIFDEFKRGQFSAMFSSVGAMMRDAGFGAKALGVGIAGLAGIGVVESVHKMIINQGQLAESLMNSAAAAGMSVHDYALLQQTMEVAGGGSQRLAASMRILATDVQTALAEPFSKQRSGFDQIFGDQSQQILQQGQRNPLQLILDMRKAFQALPADLQRTVQYTDAAGRSWQTLAPILRLNDEEIKKIMADIERIGVPDETTTRQLATAAQRAVETELAFHALGISIAKAFGAEDTESALKTLALSLKDLADTDLKPLIQMFKDMYDATKQDVDNIKAIVDYANKLTSAFPAGTVAYVMGTGPPPAVEQVATTTRAGPHGSRITVPLADQNVPISASVAQQADMDALQTYIKTLSAEDQAKAAGLPSPSAAPPVVSKDAAQLVKDLEQTIKNIRAEHQKIIDSYTQEAAQARAVHNESAALAAEHKRDAEARKTALLVQAEGQKTLAEAERLHYKEPEVKQRIQDTTTQAQHEASQATVQLIRTAGQAQDQNTRKKIDELRATLELTHGEQQRLAIAQQIAAEEAKLTGGAAGRLIMAKQEAEAQREVLTYLERQAQIAQTRASHQEHQHEIQQRIQSLTSGGDRSISDTDRRANVQQITASAAQQIAIYEQLANKMRAQGYDEMQIFEKVGEREFQIVDTATDKVLEQYEKMAQAARKTADEMEKPFKDAFDTIGKGIEGVASDALKLYPGHRATLFDKALVSTTNRLTSGLVTDVGELDRKSVV